MKWVYLRWGGVLLTGLVIFVLGIQRYQREVKTVSPRQLFQDRIEQTVRVRGMVSAGTLALGASPNEASFQLEAEGEHLSVEYRGEDPENLRELKTLVVIGRLHRATEVFHANEIALIPNFGFVVAAYLLGLVPIALFLFRMEWRVAMLYHEIRSLKGYEPEVGQN